MNTLSLQALTIKGVACKFSIYDVPVAIDDEQFILMAKPGSPILRTQTIVSCTDIPNVCEGTILTDNNGVDYVVSFKRGFAAMDAQRAVVKISDIVGCHISGSIDLSTIALCRQRLIYRYKDLQFQLKDFVGISDGKAIIKESHTPIELSNVQQYAGLTYNGKNVFFGDYIDGFKVVMHKGRICMDCGDHYVDIADMQVLK